jgi:hypothetical protein
MDTESLSKQMAGERTSVIYPTHGINKAILCSGISVVDLISEGYPTVLPDKLKYGKLSLHYVEIPCEDTFSNRASSYI